jgi:hypothetical protein
MKKGTGKWCEFHKILWNKIDGCHSINSLVEEMKALESEEGSDYESNPDKGKRIIDVELISTIATTKVQPSDPKEP